MGEGVGGGVPGGVVGGGWGVIWTWWMDRCLVLYEGMDGIDPESLAQAIHSCGMDTLRARREELRQYELESYAAIGRRVCEALEQGTRSYVDLGHDPLARYTRVIEVTTPAYLELSE